MREIKFRAWDNTINWMEYDPTISESAVDGLAHTDLNDWLKDHEYFEFMQYTGLKDKNGKEIYEGDIVQHKYHKKDAAVIEWVAEGWKVRVDTPKGVRWHEVYEGQSDDYGNGRLALYEVIGNIYENPTLIKESKNGTANQS